MKVEGSVMASGVSSPCADLAGIYSWRCFWEALGVSRDVAAPDFSLL